MKIVTVFFIFFLYPFTSYAAGTAEELLIQCENAKSYDYCVGYITGFYDGRTTDDYGIAKLSSCPPSDASGENLQVTYSQMARVFVAWASDNPDKLHLADWQAVRQALAEAWPCD
jgi:hypothetical protein